MSSANTLQTAEARERDRQAFLKRSGWGDAARTSLGGDASTRRYELLTLGSQTAYFMDAPPNAESPICSHGDSADERIAKGWNAMNRLAASRVDAFVAIDAYLDGLGLSVPEVCAVDLDRGFAVLENLGDRIFAREIESGASEAKLYEAAIDVLAHVHTQPVPESLPVDVTNWPILSYDELALISAADLFRDWYPQYDESVAFSETQAAEWDELIAGYCAELAALPTVLLLRDYHAENLIWIPEREGLKRVGILDFQDAIAGPAAWDVAMFLQDARRDVSAETHRLVVHRYLTHTGQDEATFSREYAIAGAINALRIVGVFARLVHRDKKPRYETFLPREWGHLRACLKHVALKDLQGLLHAVAPTQMELA